MIKIGIVGSRRRNETKDFEKLREYLLLKLFAKLKRRKKIKTYSKDVLIISGGCKTGADAFAERLAAGFDIKIRIHYPNKEDIDTELLKVNRRAAYTKINYARNKLIAKQSNYLIALVAEDRKGGTENTIKYFLQFHNEKRLIIL